MIKLLSIPKEREFSLRDAKHNKRDPIVREANIRQDPSKEFPADLVVGFFEIHFHNKIALTSLAFFKGMNRLLKNDNIIMAPSTWNERALCRPNKIRKKRAESR